MNPYRTYRVLLICWLLVASTGWASVFPSAGPKLTATGAAGGDEFGFSISLDDTTLAAGAPKDNNAQGANAGSVHLFYQDQGGADQWGQVKVLTASDGGNDDQFGYAVALSGDVLVVGMPFDGAGAAYVFERDEGGADAWGLATKLVPTNSLAGDQVGFSVDVSGFTVVVGAPFSDVQQQNAGAIFVFERTGGSNLWEQTATVTATDASQQEDQLGTAVALDGDLLVAGAPGDNSPLDSGAAYVFSRNLGGAGAWGQVKKVLPSDPSSQDEFGAAVALQGNRLVVGAPEDTRPSPVDGAAYVFERNLGGTSQWGQAAKLEADEPFSATGDRFGEALAVRGDVVLVGASEARGGTSSDAGAAYLFGVDVGGTGNWGQSFKLTASDAGLNDHFGHSVDLIDDWAVAGAIDGDKDFPGAVLNSGAAYLYSLTFNTAPTINEQAFAINENSPPGFLVGTVIADPGEPGQTLQYTITAGNGDAPGAFAIHATNGQLTVSDAVQIDHETNPQFQLTVEVADNGVPSLTDSNTVTVTINDLPEMADLSVRKEGPASAVSGTVITYDLVVSNAGPETAAAVMLEDIPPSGVTALDPLVYALGAIPAGSSQTVAFRVAVSPSTTGVLVNTATVLSSTPDPTSANNSDSLATTLTQQADLQIIKTSPPTATAGTEFSYSLIVQNLGPSDATNVIVNDTLPAGVVAVGLTNVQLGTVASGASVPVTIDVFVDATTTGVVVNAASVTSDVADPNLDNNTDTAPTLILTSADLQVFKTGPASVSPGANFAYQVLVVNNGPSAARDVQLTDQIPVGVLPAGAQVLDIPILLPAQQVVTNISVTASPSFRGTVTNVATAASATDDPDPNNNTDSVATLIIESTDLGILKSGPVQIIDSNRITYVLLAFNLGPDDATNVVVQDMLPPGVVFDALASSSNCVEQTGTVTCTVPFLANFATTSLTVVVEVDTHTTGNITNTASVSYAGLDPVSGNETSTWVVEVRDFDQDGLPDFADPDGDGDGMPNDWEESFMFDPFDPVDAGQNADIDPLTNLEEYIADTLPRLSTSFFTIDSISEGPPVCIGFQSSTARVYTVEWYDPITQLDWSVLPGQIDVPGAGGPDSLCDTNSIPGRSYRLKVRVP